MNTTKVFSMLLRAYLNPKVRIIILRGGTRSGKTWAVMQFLNWLCERSKTHKRTVSVVSETMPHLKRGAIKDFKEMLEKSNAYNGARWHDTDKYYRYKKAMLEFFSADAPGKVTGPARQILYINECINVSFEVFRQLAVRTEEKIILDYNPAFDFWVDEKLIGQRDDLEIIDSTYLDNDMLSAAQIAEIELNREIDPDWWNVYGLGLKGSRKGLVLQNWDIVDSLPKHFKNEYGAIDFGWTAPTSLSHLRVSEGDVYIHQVAYSPGMDNPAIAKAIKAAGLERMVWVCDIAEPKSIAELQALGINAVGADSKNIKLGIAIMNRWRKHFTKESVETIKEARNYRYAKDRTTDEYGDMPADANNHAMDGIRYVFLKYLSAIAPPKLHYSFKK